MKRFAVAAIALVSLGIGTSASTASSNFKFSPPTTAIVFQGSFSLTKGGATAPCNAVWQFKTNAIKRRKSDGDIVQ